MRLRDVPVKAEMGNHARPVLGLCVSPLLGERMELELSHLTHH